MVHRDIAITTLHEHYIFLFAPFTILLPLLSLLLSHSDKTDLVKVQSKLTLLVTIIEHFIKAIDATSSLNDSLFDRFIPLQLLFSSQFAQEHLEIILSLIGLIE